MRKKLFVLLLLTLVSTTAFADGIMGSGTRSEEEERAIIGSGGRQILGSGTATEAMPQIGSGAALDQYMGSGGRSIFGSGGLAQRLLFTFARTLATGLIGSGT